MNNDKLQQLRRDYKNNVILDGEMGQDPFVIFDQWLQAIVARDHEDPTAMVLSTVDSNLKPDSRVVLLKAVKDKQFIFYTNYSSHKAEQLSHNPSAALNFFWPSMCRQVRIRGTVTKLSYEASNRYFSTRPRDSQIGALASRQSSEVTRKALDERFNELNETLVDQVISCPDFWGGYALVPDEFEFWQGLESRLHDRFHFYLGDNNTWHLRRLAP